MIWWRLMGCMVRPGWPLQECLQLCPQAAVSLPLAQPDLSALCGIFPHQYLQAVTPSQLNDPTTYYCHQEIEPHCMQEAFEGRKVWQFSYGCTLKDEWRFWTRAQLSACFQAKGSLFFSKLLNVIELVCHLALHFRSLLIHCKWVSVIEGKLLAPLPAITSVLRKEKKMLHKCFGFRCRRTHATLQLKFMAVDWLIKEFSGSNLVSRWRISMQIRPERLPTASRPPLLWVGGLRFYVALLPAWKHYIQCTTWLLWFDKLVFDPPVVLYKSFWFCPFLRAIY